MMNRAWAHYLLVTAVAAVMSFGSLKLVTMEQHESKAAMAARNMVNPQGWLDGSDGSTPPPRTSWNRWLVPVNNGLPRLQKTPLPYWLMAGAAYLLNDPKMTEFTARLPSAAGGVLCCLIVLALGRRMFSARAALLGALLLATSVGFQEEARSARPDMLLCLFMTAAMACFYLGIKAATRGGRATWMMLFWLCMGLANLCKQFFPLLLALPLAAFVLWEDQERRSGASQPRRALATYAIGTGIASAVAIGVTLLMAHLRPKDSLVSLAFAGLVLAAPLLWYAIRTRGWPGVGRLLPTAVPGAILMFAAFLPWMWYVKGLFGGAGALFSEEVTERAAGTGKWNYQTPLLYLQALLEFSLPWIVLLPGAMAAAWMNRFREHRRGLVFLFLWAAGMAALLAVASGKREHYLWPAMPAVALLMGFIAEDVFFRHQWISPALGRRIAAGFAGAMTLMPLGVAAGYLIGLTGFSNAAHVADQRGRWVHMAVVTAFAAIPAAAALVLSLRRRLALVPALLMLSTAMVFVGFNARADLWDLREVNADYARKAAEIIGPSQPVGAWQDPQAKTVYYFGRNIPTLTDRRAQLVRKLGDREGKAAFAQWVTDPKNVSWIFGYGFDLEELRALGYQEVLRCPSPEQKKLVFLLLKNSRLGS